MKKTDAQIQRALREAEGNFDMAKALEAIRRKYPGIERFEGQRRALLILFADARTRLGITLEQETAYRKSLLALPKNFESVDWQAKIECLQKQLAKAKKAHEQREYDYRLAVSLGEQSADAAFEASLVSQKAEIAEIEQEISSSQEQQRATKQAISEAEKKCKKENSLMEEFIAWCGRHQYYYSASAEKERDQLDSIDWDRAYRD